ncbi:MAG TPA: nuclear transport factor 2 family protein [Rhizomicrobium sp.]
MENIEKTVADLDTRYQAAVKINDVDTMSAILHESMILVRGNGAVVTREEILNGARSRDTTYEIQDEERGTQKVRVWGEDTAVVTAKLRIKGHRRDGESFDRTVWFSDTYVRTSAGWRYAFAQVTQPQ